MDKIISKHQFDEALNIIKCYKEQNKIKYKSLIADSVLNMEKSKFDLMLNYIFEQDKYLGYSEIVKKMIFVLNNDLLFKIGTINVKIVFKKLIENKIIISDKGFSKNSHRNRYYLNMEKINTL